MMTIKQALQGVAQILQEVKAIGYLHRLGCAFRCPLSIRTCPVAANHLDLGCSRSHCSTTPAVRSGKRSITVCASRSTMIVP